MRRTAGSAATRGEVPVVGHVSPARLQGPAGAAVMERSNFPAPKCVSVPPTICSQPTAERTTINKWNEKCDPVFVLKERVEITDSL